MTNRQSDWLPKQSNSWKAYISLASQDIPISVEANGSLLYSQEPTTSPCPKPGGSSSFTSILLKIFPYSPFIYEVWSKTTVNAAAECDPMERKGSSVREAAHWTLVTVCDKFQLVRCSQSVVSYGWEKVCFKVCRKSWVANRALTGYFVSNCKKVLKKYMKC